MLPDTVSWSSNGSNRVRRQHLIRPSVACVVIVPTSLVSAACRLLNQIIYQTFVRHHGGRIDGLLDGCLQGPQWRRARPPTRTDSAPRRIDPAPAHPQDSALADGHQGGRRDQHAQPGHRHRSQRGLALPLLPVEAGPAGGGARGAGLRRRPGRRLRHGAVPATPPPSLADLLDDILQSMLEVEDFVRLMLGEVMRGDDTAFAVGTELFAATQASLEHSLAECRSPPVPTRGGGGHGQDAPQPCWSGSSSSTWPGCSATARTRRPCSATRAEEFATLLDKRPLD